MMPLGIKTGPILGVTSWNQRNKDVEFIFWENDSDEQSRAIMALLFPQVLGIGNDRFLDLGLKDGNIHHWLIVVNFCKFHTHRSWSSYPHQNKCFWGYTGIGLSVYLSVYKILHSFCQSASGGI